MPQFRLLGLVALLFMALPALSLSQSREAFLTAFAGEWLVFDPAFSTSTAPCSMALEANLQLGGSVLDESQLRPTAQPNNCVAPLNSVTAWDIEDSQLVLYAPQDALVARLGGNQNRVTGDIQNSFATMILERATGDPYQISFSAALKRHRCIYSGYSPTCSTQDELARPIMSEEGGVVASLEILVRLNVRDQPRRNSRIVGTLPPQACLRVNYCTTASDGIWCRASFGEASGWVSKTALRQEEWPVSTFRNGCPEGN